MDQNNFQFGEENRTWLSLLPLFEAEHWPTNLYPGDDNMWLTTCLCMTEEHDTVCIFPYARYGNRRAWYLMEAQLRLINAHYEEPVAAVSAEENVSATWPNFFRSIFLQSWDFYPELWCMAERDESYNGCSNSPYWYPYWSTDEVEYRHCTCPANIEDPESSHSDLSEDDWNLGERSVIWVTTSQMIFTFRQESVVLEDGSSIGFGFHGQIGSGNTRKGVRISEFNPWEFQVVAEEYEVEDPPKYESVSELPSYEEATNPTNVRQQ